MNCSEVSMLISTTRHASCKYTYNKYYKFEYMFLSAYKLVPDYVVNGVYFNVIITKYINISENDVFCFIEFNIRSLYGT